MEYKNLNQIEKNVYNSIEEMVLKSSLNLNSIYHIFSLLYNKYLTLNCSNDFKKRGIK